MKRTSSTPSQKTALREKAVALQYRDLESLPSICAAGTGEWARKIMALAKEHDIRIEQNPELTEMLAGLRVGDSVNPQSFSLVAELICFLYHVDQEWRAQHSFLDKVLALPNDEKQN
ncbi:MAG: hypothetical protein GX589_06005 [Deltaproteobacteria bacterium]|nr:hypothetical protein [Deltaproteobacteria bacterium]